MLRWVPLPTPETTRVAAEVEASATARVLAADAILRCATT
jgi:hypothetical protein